MISAADIRQKLALVARNNLSLNEFERWVDPYVWDVDDASDAQNLMESMQLLFSERNDGLLDARDLRRELFALYSDMRKAVVFEPGFSHVIVRDILPVSAPSVFYLVNPPAGSIRAVA
jgi:hypothetical protein